VAAPGCNTAPLRGGGYGSFCGTSSATPVVAGIAGLALSLEPNVGKEPSEQALTSTARAGPSTVGHGRVDALKTLAALGLTAPLNTARPAIRGTPLTAVPLEGWPGRWLGASTFTYQWLRCASASVCVNIPGAISATYAPSGLDIGSRLRFVVRARNVHGVTTQRSKLSALVERAPDGTSAGVQGPYRRTAPAAVPRLLRSEAIPAERRRRRRPRLRSTWSLPRSRKRWRP